MQHFAHFDASGLLIALFNDDVYPPESDGSINAAIPAEAIAITEAQWQDLIGNQGRRQLAHGVIAPYDPPAPVIVAFATGRDVVDGMSPAQAKAANDVDPRNLARISAARTAAEVKSCIARVEKAAGLAAGALLAQATPSGGLP